MKDSNGEYIVNLINDKGERLHIPYSEALELDKLIAEGKSEKYYPDVEWDLSHGYRLAEDAFMEIEQTGEVFKQTLNGDFDDFDLLSDKAQKQIIKLWPKEVWTKYRRQ